MPRSNYAHRLNESPDLIFADERARMHRAHWREFFGKRIGPTFNGEVIFEIGCNDATFLTTIAQKHPDTAFIGLDWKVKAIYDAATRVSELKLNNVVLLRGRAQDIAKIFAPTELDEIWIFHPDPCDRDVELKNRLIAEPFLLDAFEVLCNRRGSICLKTDHAEYYQSVLRVLAGDAIAARFVLAMASAGYWADSAAIARTEQRYFAHEVTTYERRFINKRRPIYYVELSKRGR
jgi:tRNA (guanine-N(7)-)-methyltransferase